MIGYSVQCYLFVGLPIAQYKILSPFTSWRCKRELGYSSFHSYRQN